MRVYRADRPPTADDVRALRGFLESPNSHDEKALQHLLECHPPLVGILGFFEFVSECPIYKNDSSNEPLLADLRRRDRIDLLAATKARLELKGGVPYLCTHIIELKSARSAIAERNVGARLSDAARKAVDQLKEYRQLLTTVPENRNIPKSLGWDVRSPILYLIMGGDQEFASNPGQLEEVRSRLNDAGVRLYTVDDVLWLAARSVEARVIPQDVYGWSSVRQIGTAIQVLVRREDGATDIKARPPLGFERQAGFRPRGGGFGEPRELHGATCGRCYQEIQVPFKPVEGRPVFCRDCYMSLKEQRQ
jgi:CxxC-x17-CxxC domain-containing protein